MMSDKVILDNTCHNSIKLIKKLRSENLVTDTRHLTDNRIIHQYRGGASNIYIIVDNVQGMSFLVDCGMPSDVRSLAKTLDLMPPLKRVVCTHFHVDHVSGWINLKSIFKNCSIWFHESGKPSVLGLDRVPFPTLMDFKNVLLPCMREVRYFPSLSDLLQGGLYGTPFRKGFPLGRVEFFASDQQVLPGFITLHTPGHRPESASFFDQKSGILISGDCIIVLGGEVTNNMFLWSKKEQKASISKIKQMDELRLIFPGHGVCRPFSKEGLTARNYLR